MYMNVKMEFTALIHYFALFLLLNSVTSSNITTQQNEAITTLDLVFNATSTMDPIPDIRKLLNDLEAKYPEELFRLGVGAASEIIMPKIVKLRREINKLKANNAKMLALNAPAYIRKYIEQTKDKFLMRFLFDIDINNYQAIVEALGAEQQTIDKRTRELQKRVEEDEEFDLSDSLLEKLSLHYVSWKYIFTKSKQSHTDVQQLKELLENSTIDEDTFAFEMAYLWARCSNLGIPYIPEISVIITLNTLLDGLHFYKMSFLHTRIAISLLYQIFTN